VEHVEIADAEMALRALIERAGAGEQIVLTDNGVERVRLVPVPACRQERAPLRLGLLAGRARIPPDFDAPLPDDLLDLFEGR